VVLQSSIPLGVGIGSSAAIEVAMMHALNRRLGLGLEGIELARLCQIVENRVVGAPCGIMDQVVSTLGKEGQLLAIKCQPGEVLRSVPLPDSCAVAGISSRVKHSVGGTQYTDVRVGAFMGHKIILNHLKANPKDDPFGGYLSRVSPERYRKEFARFLPSEMLGADFLARHDETVDPVTTVCAAKTYRVRSRTEHPIYENARVNRFIECLDRAVETGDERPLIQAGRLMYASHWSYRHRCGLDSPETLLLVNLARGIGVKGGIYGAKITGGGSGGTVAVLGRRETLAQNLQKMAERYEKATGITPDIFVGSSPGAEEFGHLEYAPEKGA
jgi:L-arabinokinase